MLVVSVFIGGTALLSPDQWLVLAAGLLFSLLMTYVTGLSTMLMKKPRQGLYVAAVLELSGCCSGPGGLAPARESDALGFGQPDFAADSGSAAGRIYPQKDRAGSS